MQEAKTFVRGQIWYWRDPIYGEKGDGAKIHLGEGKKRYSRYVLILNVSPSQDSIISVIPLTSQYEEGRIPVMINHKTSKQTLSYADPIDIMPIHALMCNRYVGTVTDETMNIIDGCIINTLIPNMKSTLSDESKSLILKDAKIDLNYDLSTIKIPQDEEAEEKNKGIWRFVKQCIKYTAIDANFIKAKDLLVAYRKWCINNKCKAEEDDLNVFSAIIQYINPNISIAYRKELKNKALFNIASIGRCKLIKVSDEITINMVDPNTVHNNTEENTEEKTKKKRISWDLTKQKEFIGCCNKLGIEEAAKSYEIKLATAKKYFIKFQQTIMEAELEEHKAPINSTIIKDESPIRGIDNYISSSPMVEKRSLINHPSTYNILRLYHIISSVSSGMTDSLRHLQIVRISDFNDNISEVNEMYTKLNRLIYNCLCQSLSLPALFYQKSYGYTQEELDNHIKSFDWDLIDILYTDEYTGKWWALFRRHCLDKYGINPKFSSLFLLCLHQKIFSSTSTKYLRMRWNDIKGVLLKYYAL